MTVELALGTAQFGMRYGIAGRGEPVPREEVRAILRLAWDGGIRLLDTAPVYGDIEERLLMLSEERAFAIVSKIPAIPDTHPERFVMEAVRRTSARLGDRLYAVLFHKAADLCRERGAELWRCAVDGAYERGIRLGVSCYSGTDASALCSAYPISVVQVPGNAFDQRLRGISELEGVEIHLRSVFLQGLLLMSPEEAEKCVPAAGPAMRAWDAWCRNAGMTALDAALGVVKGFRGVRYCVVGVDRPAHLERIIEAWNRAEPMDAPQLAVEDHAIIDPRRWVVRERR